MKTMSEKLDYCKQCKNRKFSPTTGLVCGKTMAKPQFEDICPGYDKDALEAEKIEERKAELERSDKISGFFAFYVYWAIPIGIISTLISSIRNFNSNLYGGFNLLEFSDLAFLALYIFSGIYAMISMVKKRADAIFWAKTQLVLSFISNLLLVILAITVGVSGDFSPISITSLIWSVAFFCFLSLSDQVNDWIPKQDRRLPRWGKCLFAVWVGILIISWVGGIKESYRAAQLEQVCKESKKLLPIDLGNGLTWTNMFTQGNVLVYQYTYTNVDEQSINSNYLDYISIFSKLNTKRAFASNSVKDDLALDLCVKNKYAIKYQYLLPSRKEFYSFSFSSAEVAEALGEDYTFSVSNSDFNSLIDAYNTNLPTQYTAKCVVTKVYTDEDMDVIYYDLQFVDIDRETLYSLDCQILKSYLVDDVLPYVYDGVYIMSKANGLDIVYNFTSDTMDWWNYKVRLKANELPEPAGERIY